MANVLMIKRATSTVVPPSLAAGELAYTQINGTTWIGRPSDNLVMPIKTPDPVLTVRLASTANISTTYTATSGTYATGQHTGCPNSIDGKTLVAGDRILLKDQTTGAQNGVYVVTTLGTGANGVWDRAWDFGSQPFALVGLTVKVGPEGTTNPNKIFDLTNAAGFTIGTGSGSTLTFADHNTTVTTVGTITSGTWNGSTITVPYGGTGVATLTGLVKGNGAAAMSAAVAGTDYLGPTGGATVTTVGTISSGTWNGSTITVPYGGTGVATLTGLVKGNGAAAMSAAVAGTDYLSPSSTIDCGTF